jgi:hypothetical protein
MRFLISILAFFTPSLLAAQTFNEQLLVGSWKIHAYIVNNDTTFYNGLVAQHYVMTFYPDSVFQEEQVPISKTDSTQINSTYSGKWMLVDNKIYTSQRKPIFVRTSFPMSNEVLLDEIRLEKK